MNNNLTVKNNIKKFNYLKILIPAISTIPICIYILTLKNIDRGYIFPIFLNIHFFISLYLFCFTVIFHINNLNKKLIFITFLSFLFISLIAIFSNISFNYVYMPPANTPDFQILINRLIFFNIIFFVIMMLSYNSFNVTNTDSISDFFTLFADTFIWFLIINTGSSTILSILFSLLFIVGFSIMELFSASTGIGFTIAKLVICSIIFLYGFIPFISYYIYNNTKSVISIYLSRFFLVINLFSIFIMMFFMLPYEARPYNNRFVYVLYNIILSLTIINLMFARMDKKSNIFIKAMYLIVPIFALLFDILTITATIYRIVNYGLTPNKLTLLILNILFLIHLILISLNTIKSFINSFQNREYNNTLNIIIDNKHLMFIYVYLVFSVFVCFVMPIMYIN
ncbi:hypothetical protein BHAMNSH16_03175 [Brachyspira hampsonii]|uniref:Uncharacterized protein n=1 Tax=Brachyspira hampsonii TaxID=1287055 RepID=A0AAC9TT10_9SPIR|nr:hypothetical protein [Brachyspira hampsonii]ASJ20704.1 hypothetical protein BHAMNSH16_03175 [Brachyspira hampsonii]MBW5379347.1 hypothetical protein [Brachyspira hampsonii]OEJ18119.1 hypothetical protein A9496_08895 [Brachyspira hampsonii]